MYLRNQVKQRGRNIWEIYGQAMGLPMWKRKMKTMKVTNGKKDAWLKKKVVDTLYIFIYSSHHLEFNTFTAQVNIFQPYS